MKLCWLKLIAKIDSHSLFDFISESFNVKLNFNFVSTSFFFTLVFLRLNLVVVSEWKSARRYLGHLTLTVNHCILDFSREAVFEEIKVGSTIDFSLELDWLICPQTQRFQVALEILASLFLKQLRLTERLA